MLYKNMRFFMRYKIGLLVLIIGASLMFCFTANSLAESTIVIGSNDKLIVLTYTKYLDGKPVLIFTEQASEKLSNNLLDKVNNIVFCDSTWQDLAVELVEGKVEKNQHGAEVCYIFEKEDGEFWAKGRKEIEVKVKIEVKGMGLIPLIKIDDKIFRLNDFEGWQDCKILEGGVLSMRIELVKGKHKYEKLENKNLDVEWIILEPVGEAWKEAGRGEGKGREEPKIIFKKINPTKYLVKVEGARSPFWLVFSESFHKQWKIYRRQTTDDRRQTFKKIVADYPKLGVKEAKHLVKFTPQDISYLFKKPLDAEHHLVNTYANGWYIEPGKLGLGENFTLVIYFWPQTLFYLGLGISGLTFLGCLIYLICRCFPFSVKRRGRG